MPDHNVDSLLADIQIQESGQTPVMDNTQETDNKVATESITEQVTAEETPVQQQDDYQSTDETPDKGSEKQEETPVDDYGNTVEKAKMYSEEEVQRMIRERLSRGRHAEQPVQQQNNVAQETQTDTGGDDWEQQLESLVERTIEKKQQRHQQENWQRQEQQKQADFEAKFNTGMSKYKDFQQVVADKPITDSMMLAARTLENPAAFIYAACKTQAKELDRIARLPDAFQQATEIGRLEARMKRNKAATSNAAKPITPAKGDYSAQADRGNNRNLDAMIIHHAKQKQSNRR